MKRCGLILSILLILASVCTAVAEEWTCPSCGESASGNYCSNCGTPKPEEIWVCPKCGLEATGNYCGNCGSPKPVEWICSNCGEKATGNFCSNCGKAYMEETHDETYVEEDGISLDDQEVIPEVEIEKESEDSLKGANNEVIETDGNTTDTKDKSSLGEKTEKWLSENGYDFTNVIVIASDVLYDYGSSYVGKTVLTSITVEDKTSTSLKANTSNNSTFSFSVIAEFSDKSEIQSVKEKDTVIVIGNVDKMNTISLFGSDKTVTLKNSHIINTDLTTETIESERERQILNAKTEMESAELKATEAALQEKDEYKKTCETVSYAEVERNLFLLT